MLFLSIVIFVLLRYDEQYVPISNALGIVIVICVLLILIGNYTNRNIERFEKRRFVTDEELNKAITELNDNSFIHMNDPPNAPIINMDYSDIENSFMNDDQVDSTEYSADYLLTERLKYMQGQSLTSKQNRMKMNTHNAKHWFEEELQEGEDRDWWEDSNQIF